MKRQHFELEPGEPFILDVGGQNIEYGSCTIIATFDNFDANISDALLKTANGRYTRVTIVGDEEDRDPYGGIAKGWYVARLLNEEAAANLGEVWGMKREDVLQHYPPEDY